MNSGTGVSMFAGEVGEIHRMVCRSLRRGLVTILAVVLLPLSVQAQGVRPDTPPALKAEYEAAFQTLLADPSNLDKSFKFAELAIKVGDYEGAIGTLERMLIVDPDLWRVRMDLGILYFRLGSYGTARNYLESALAIAATPAKERGEIAELIDQIESRRAANQLSGSLALGFMYQSNATAAPSTGTVRSSGVPTELSDRFTAQSDTSVFSTLSLTHTYDLRRADRLNVQTNMLLSGSKQRHEESVDQVYFALDSGPRIFVTPEDADGPWLRPFATLDYVYLGRGRLFWAPGAGAELGVTLAPKLSGRVSYRFRDERYRNSASNPTASGNDGIEQRGDVHLEYGLTDQVTLALQGYVLGQNASDPSQSNMEYSGQAGVYAALPAPLGLTAEPWNAALTASWTHVRFDMADPLVDPNVRRRDDRWSVQLIGVVPIAGRFSAMLGAGYSDSDSNLPNYEFTNKQLFVAAFYRF